jgi:hypothetical protein
VKARVNVVKPSKIAKVCRDIQAGKIKLKPKPVMTDDEQAAFEKKQEEEKLQHDIARRKADYEAKTARRAKNNGHAPPKNAAGPYRQAEALQAQKQHCVVQPTKPDDSTGVGPCSGVTKEQFYKRLKALEHMLNEVPRYSPKAAKKVAIRALEEVRRLRLDVGQDDTAEINRTMLGAELLKGRRTRFYVCYAEHGIHLSALLFLVASYTRRRWNAGKRGQQAGWRNTAEWFGAQLGIGERQVRRLVAHGKQLQLLDYLRTRRGLLVWLKAKVYAKPDINKEDEFNIGHYYLRLARLLGLNASILFRFLKISDEDGNRKRLTAQGAAHRFPWLSQKGASVELHRLFCAGAIQRERARLALSANADWMYYWRQRTQEDRDKWRRVYKDTLKNSKVTKCPL